MADVVTPAGRRPVALAILDGWGIGRDEPGNAILAANTPTMDRLLRDYPNAILRTSGESVGLPPGQMGNSEVGHLNLGAGFVVYQWISRIDRSIADRSFFANPALCAAIDGCIATGGTLHLLGLVSDGGVHSHSRHLVALLELCRDRGLARAAVHAFTDGRDTSPTSGRGFLSDLERNMSTLGVGRFATISGRYYAMDRDRRWERTKRAYDAVVDGKGSRASTSSLAIDRAYAEGQTDEFVAPTVIGDFHGMHAGDAAIFFNFRSDRCRQIAEAMTMPSFDGFERGRSVRVSCPVTTLTRYEERLPVAIAFPPHDVVMPVARVIAEAGLSQFHCAETEKYAHVTFFFNGGREEPFPGEERALIPSARVATYDLQPEMSAVGVTDAVIAAIESGRFDFLIVNFANCDMVGHTGVFSAAVSAVETVDRCLGRVLEAMQRQLGISIVTADHGNAEMMIDVATGGPMTAHTTNPVPVIVVAPEESPFRVAALRDQSALSSVAPTLLRLLGLTIPSEMTTPDLFA